MVKSGMSRIMRNDVADGAVGSEGGRSPSALSHRHNGAATGYAGGLGRLRRTSAGA